MRLTMEQRFWSRVDTSSDCWLWTGSTFKNGYGKFRTPSVSGVRGRNVSAHRYSAMLHFGMFDQRLQVLHRCDNPGCVRPDHLFLGDRSLNMQDMAAKGRAAGQRKTHCVNGHEFTPENTLLNVGKRCCRECRRLQAAAGYARRGNGRG